MLRRSREQAQLTQEELAERAGVSARTVSDAERGIRRRLYADTAGRLADALGLAGTQREEFVSLARGRAGSRPGRDYAVPDPLTPLLGRTAETDRLERELDPDGEHRLVSVTGLGGIGKTRLAVAVAERLRPRYDERVRFLALADVEPRQLPTAVAAVFSTVPDRLPGAIGERPTLLVLDAFEHVRGAASWLGQLLELTPALRVLVTSRTRVGVRGEREIVLAPLDEHTARRLFCDRAEDVGVQIEGGDPAVSDICALASCLPLPLELAAAQARYLPLTVVRDRLRDGVADASRVVEGAVTWSIGSLSDDERRVLSAAAMFPSGCRLEALAHVCPSADVVASLGTLADKSLVTLDSSGIVPRWRMLDAVRDAATRLTPADAEARSAYVDFYLRFLREADVQVGSEVEWYQQLAAEDHNIGTALSWAEAERDADGALELATGMWRFWQSRGDLVEGRRRLTAGLALQPPAATELRMTALWGLAWLAYHQGDDDVVERAGAELSSLAENNADGLAQRNALTVEGIVAIAHDRTQRAIAALGEALDRARSLERPWILATSLLNLALAHLAAGSPAEARPLIGEALRGYEAIGDQRFRARCLCYLGMTSLLEDDATHATALFATSLAAFRELDEPAGTAEALAGLAAVAAATGDPERAAVLAGAAERLRDSVAARELPLERRIAARFLGDAATQMSDEDWQRAWQRGRRLGLDEIAGAVGLSPA